MKKLLVAAGAVAIAAGAFAVPEVYDYKASLKNMYLKEVTVSYKDSEGKATKAVVYMKYQKSTSLKGYLIMDSDGVTSPTIMKDRLDNNYGSLSTGFDYGRNRGFLVVINPSAYKDVRHPKILPAILDAKWLDTSFSKLRKATSGPAEGFLYVGGDAVKPVRPQLDELTLGITQRDAIPYVPYSTEAEDTAGSAPAAEGTVATNYTGMVAVADYVWTSVYLFSGSTKRDAFFNGPNWFTIAGASPFGMFEYAWDQNLPELLRTGWYTNDFDMAAAKTPVNYFHDTWMNGSGVGKWTSKTTTTYGDWCCGIVSDDIVDTERPKLDSLSGNLKGGLFLCTENGIDAKKAGYNWFRDYEWEDQFNTARLSDTDVDLFAADSWQNDLWQDGFLEIETTDVIYGTWSIKRATEKFYAKKNPIVYDFTDPQTDTVKAAYKAFQTAVATSITADKIPAEFVVEEEGLDEQGEPVTKKYSFHDGKVSYDLVLWGAIYGASRKLDKDANVYDGTEIYTKSTSNRANIPVVTPQFALFYRLFYGADYTKTEQQ